MSAKIRFVTTPFLPEYQPSLGISNLLSIVKNAGYEADINYLNIAFGGHFGWDLYNIIAIHTPPEFLIGEYIFTKALGINESSDFDEFKNKVIEELKGSDEIGDITLQDLFDAVEFLFDNSCEIVDKWADEILKDNPQIIGFSTTFQQNTASLALAKEIKKRKGDLVKVIFGGANCEGDMGKTLLANFNFIDYVVSGEAENIIISVIQACEKNFSRNEQKFYEGSAIIDIDEIPIPDFGDFFKTIKEVSVDRKVYLSFESSRGCWWGMKSHCTFCGLNGGNMNFRLKNANHFIEQVSILAHNYKINDFMITDNILAMPYIDTVFQHFSNESSPFTFFYETKSNIKKEQLITLYNGGVKSIQPGIESLSSSILDLMAKGSTKIQNIQLLKWGKELDMRIIWNFLYGFPGEQPEEYDQMAELIPLLHHLTPPLGMGKIRIDRFSPYWQHPQRYLFKNLRYYWSYQYVYKLSEPSLKNLAYYFEFDYLDNQKPEKYSQRCLIAVQKWIESSSTSTLKLIKTEDGKWEVNDTRECRLSEKFQLNDLEFDLLHILDQPQSISAITKNLIERSYVETGELTSLVEAAISILEKRNLIVNEDHKYFSLITIN
jgi:ribosomal peptide maturation radical SAM protein 1